MTGLAINRMLELRVKDIAARPPVMPISERREALLRGLNLEPLPPRTDLNVTRVREITSGGCRIRVVSYESRPGLVVTAHCYLPPESVPGPHPAIIRATDDWLGKKSDPVTQASAIGLALAGFAVLVVDSPGARPDHLAPWNEREALGDPDDHLAAAISPALGIYVWDLIRGMDVLMTCADVDSEAFGAMGAGIGGLPVQYLFAVEPRVKVCVPICSARSREEQPRPRCFEEVVPGVANLGDWSEIVGLRGDDGALMVIAAEQDADFPLASAKKREERLRKAFGPSRFRFEVFPFGADCNRRMREAAVAFFQEHLLGYPRQIYVPEAIPLTDGHSNLAPANTRPLDDPELLVGPPRDSKSFYELAREACASPYPRPLEPMKRLVAWNRYGSLAKLEPGGIVALHDEGLEPNEPNSYELAVREVDLALLFSLGLSLGEFYGQYLHLALPGAPSGWEEKAFGADALTSLVASMRTLVGENPTSPAPGLVIALGPVASIAAQFLKRYRPDLTIEVSTRFSSWNEAFEQYMPQLYQPGARYLEF